MCSDMQICHSEQTCHASGFRHCCRFFHCSLWALAPFFSSSSLSAITVKMLDEGLPPVRPQHPILSHLSPIIPIHSCNFYRPCSFQSASIPFTYGGQGSTSFAQLSVALAAWPAQFQFDIFSICSISGSWVLS